MTKEEFYSNIREYKASKSLKHGNDPEVWERDSFDFAVAALTKSKLAKYAGEAADASRFETEYNGYMNKLAHMDERAAKALEQKVLASAEAKYRECLTKLIAAKHSDEPLPNEDYLEHHGIKGQKWGIRRYQNEDGTLTDAGKAKLKGYYDKGKDKKAERTFEKWTKNNLTDDENKQILKKSTIGQLLGGPIANAIGGTRELSKIYSSEAYNARLSKAIKLLNSSDYGKKLKSMVTKKSSQPKQDDIQKRVAELDSQVWKNIAAHVEKTGSTAGYDLSKDKSWLEAERLLRDKKVKHSFLDESFIEHHGILGMKWGVRRFQNPDGTLADAGKNRYLKEIASNIFKKSKLLEPKITKDVTTSIRFAGAKPYGLEHRLKTKESLERKIRTDSEEKGISLEDAAKSINDSIRYTSLLQDKNFVSSYYNLKNNLKEKGYEEIKCKNYFDLYRQGKAKHKQITCIYQDQDGNKFEIQFQTPSSIKAKELKTPLYEEVRKSGVTPERKATLEKQMDELAKTVKDPVGVFNIKSH